MDWRRRNEHGNCTLSFCAGLEFNGLEPRRVSASAKRVSTGDNWNR